MSEEPSKSPINIQPKNSSETKGIGITMMLFAMLTGLGLLTYIFQNEIDEQYNPNQSIQSHYKQSNNQTHSIEVSLRRNRSGHYVGTGLINNQASTFLLDTGATYVAIPEQQAPRLGLKKGQRIQLSTANGRTIGYQTTIKQLSIGDIHLYNIKAIITPNLHEILLGMSVLKQLEFTQRGKYLTIRQYL